MKLRKGKKIYYECSTAYEMAENLTKINNKVFNPNGLTPTEAQLDQMRRCLCQNAFSFCIAGAKLRLGGGWIIEG